MAVSRVGSWARTDSTSTSFSATLPQTPTSGRLLYMAVCQRGSSNTPTITTPSGWDLVEQHLASVALGEQELLTVFTRTATGSEGNPTIATTQSSQIGVLISEWSGLASPITLNATGEGSSTNSTSPITAALTTTNADNWMIAVAGFTNTSPSSITWGGGQTADYALTSGGLVHMAASIQDLASSGAKSPSISYSGNSGNAAIIALAFIEVADTPPADNLQRAGTLYPINSTTVDSGTGIDVRALSDTQPGATDGSQSILNATQNSNAERTFDPATASDTTTNNAQTTNGKKGWAIPTAGMAPGNANCVARLVAQTVTVAWGGLANGTGTGNAGVNDVLTPKASLWKYNTSTDTATLIAGNSGTAITKAATLAYSNSAYTASVAITIGTDVSFGANEVLMVVFGGNLACGAGLLGAGRTTTWTVDVDVSTTTVTFGTAGLRLLCSFTYTGTLPTNTGALTRVPVKKLSGATTPAAAITRVPTLLLSGSSTPTGAIFKIPYKILTGALGPTGALRRVPTKVLTATIAPAGALIRIPFKTLSGTLTSAGSLVRQAQRKLAGTVAPSGALKRTPYKVLSGSLAPTGFLRTTIVKYFSGSIAPTAEIRKTLAKYFTATIAPTGALRREANKLLSGNITPAGSIRNTVSKRLKGFLYGPAGDGSGGTTVIRRILNIMTDD